MLGSRAVLVVLLAPAAVAFNAAMPLSRASQLLVPRTTTIACSVSFAGQRRKAVGLAVFSVLASVKQPVLAADNDDSPSPSPPPDSQPPSSSPPQPAPPPPSPPPSPPPPTRSTKETFEERAARYKAAKEKRELSAPTAKKLPGQKELEKERKAIKKQFSYPK